MTSARIVYRFNAFHLDAEGFCLYRDDVPVPLAPKALDVLLLLVSRPRALLTKDEILRALWTDVAVTDNALTQVISDLRQSLGDQSRQPQYIQTVARRGYRFIAAVDRVAIESATSSPAVADPPASAPVHRAGVRETANLDAYRAFTDGRLKLEAMDAAQAPSAIADFERAIAIDPRYALPYVGLAHGRFWQFEATRAHNHPETAHLYAAIANAHRAIDLDPDLAEAHAALALTLSTAGRSAEAVAAGRRAVALEPGNWRNHCRHAIAAWGDERIAAFERVLDLYPEFAYAYFGIATVRIARGDLAGAEDTLRRGAPLQDREPSAAARFPGRGLHWLLGLIRLAGGDTRDACVEFDREIAAGGSGLYAAEFVTHAWNGHGFARLVEADFDGAVVMFRRALETMPGQARAWLGLASAYDRLGDGGKDEALSRAARSIAELQAGGRADEATLATAFSHVVNQRPMQAIETLAGLLNTAPAGMAGWTMPIEPCFSGLHAEPSFQGVLHQLAARAQ